MTTATRSRREEEVELPPAAELRRLKISREVAWYMASRGIEFPKHPPLIKTPEPSEDPDAVFSPAAVDKVMRAFRALRHTQGRWAGKPLEPAPWQVAYIIAPIFGWVKLSEHGGMVRVARNAYIEMPRKNGKSTTAGGIALYLTGADGEQGAQVVAAATTKDQAGFVFAPIKKLAESSRKLKGRFKALTGKVIHPRSGSYFAVISSLADAQHGANLHGAIIDELHVHKTPDLVEALESGTGSREQPLVVTITTADDGKPNTIYARKRRYVERLAKKVFEDPTTYGVVFGLPQRSDPLNPANWPKANPGYPESPTHAYLVSAANKARNSPVELASFKRLHAGQRTKGGSSFVTLVQWDRNAGARIRREALKGRTAFGGLDLGSVSDLTALCWLLPYPDGRDGYDALWRFWTPEDNLERLDERTAGSASLWVQEGWLELTPGNVTDYEWVRERINEDCEHYDVESVGFDTWNSAALTNALLDDGVPLIETRQGYKTMSPAMKEAQRLVIKGRRGAPVLHHGGNPVMRWMVDNLSVAIDTAGNVKPDKKNSADKIDGWSALMNAISEANSEANLATSNYEDGGMTVA
ncbi:terminase TerL endonuclease subunit [Demequina capsici]|uniref:Terminase TerL endonuclease subunit n=1 Tax=Demequina capsici TaxID=3075620 RepID=A0AA96FCD4_9MICO|nr:terminase TerL endonuclease subunit [Demequina sp. PMTSA13]WNM27543.1 terminase TerL endonuclease subunit [Demequina sp. PMTSA13]